MEPAVETILALDIVPLSITSPKYQFRTADVLTADFKDVFTGFDLVYHLAFLVDPPHNISVEEIDKINIVGSKRVFNGVVAAGVAKLVYCSSIAAYGAHPDNPEGIDEEAPLRPNLDWYYSRAKGKLEAFLDVLQARHPKTTIIRFRPSFILGPTADNPVADALVQRVFLSHNRKQRFSMCWEDDIMDAFVSALYYQQSDIFNLSGDTPLSVREIGKLLGKPVLYLPLNLVMPWFQFAAHLRLISPQTMEWIKYLFSGSILTSSEKAKQKLGWKPRFDTSGALLEFTKISSRSRNPDLRVC